MLWADLRDRGECVSIPTLVLPRINSYSCFHSKVDEIYVRNDDPMYQIICSTKGNHDLAH